MSKSADHFEEFDDHTLLKHAILRGYLASWAMVLLKRQPRVVFFDAFAGAGQDGLGNPGSPRIALEVQEMISKARRSTRFVRSAELRVALAESDEKRFRQLSATVEGVGARPGDSLKLYPGEWTSAVAEVRALTGKAPLLTFLDPYGLKGLDAAHYGTLLAGPRDELFILVSLTGAARLAGVLRATPQDLEARLAAAKDSLELFPDLYESALRHCEEELRAREARLEHEQPIARAHLQRALGSTAQIDALMRLPPEELPTEFVRELSATLRRGGAQYILTIPMRDAEGHYKYTLLHASKSTKAVEKMKEAISASLNRADLSQVMRDRIREDLSVNIEAFGTWLAGVGRGHVIPWSAQHGNSLQEILYQQTAFFQFQRMELKRWLTERGYLKRKTIEEVRFPR